jgi:hypothetical protein
VQGRLSATPSRRSLAESVRRGFLAGALASIVQAAVGHLIDRAYLPRGHDNNMAPRLVERSFQHLGRPPRPVRDWLLGSVFHQAYGAGWGSVQSVTADWLGVPAPLLTLPLGAMIYAVAFSRPGIGTLTGTEHRPDRRHPRKQWSLVAVSLIHPLAAGVALYLVDRFRPAPGARPSSS